MARKHNEENERIKRQYMQFLREAKRYDTKTVDKAADAILRFERATGAKSFKRFHIEQAVAFKRQLEGDKNTLTGKPLSKATIDGTLRAVKAFVMWLAGLCCTNPMRDSCCESSVIAGGHEQTEHTDLQDPELARV